MCNHMQVNSCMHSHLQAATEGIQARLNLTQQKGHVCVSITLCMFMHLKQTEEWKKRKTLKIIE